MIIKISHREGSDSDTEYSTKQAEKKINCPFTMGKIIALLSQHVMKETEDEFVFSPCNLQ